MNRNRVPIRRLAAVAALAAPLAAGSGPTDVQEPTLAITGVTVIPMDGRPPRSGVTVLVSEGRISAIVASEAAEIPAGATVIDGTGKFLIPGLWDMHVHVFEEESPERRFSMLVANGVTGVRDMNGPLLLEEIHALREQVERGEVLGPRFVAPGPLVDGPGRPPSALGPRVVSVATPEEARDTVRALAARGADFIKVYNRLTPELYEAILDEAKRIGISVAGHVPLTVSPIAASDAGQRSMEHMRGVLEGASPEGERLRLATLALLTNTPLSENPTQSAAAAVLEGRRNLADTYDPVLAAELYARFARNGNWHCPTLVSNRFVLLGELERESFTSDPRLEYVSAETRESWAGASYLRGLGNPTPEQRRKRFRLQQEAVAEMYRAGVGVIAGTDVGAPYTYAGFSIHDELQLMVEGGLTPAEALGTATRDPAEFLGWGAELGTVEEGKIADLVLLDANPLEEVGSTRAIAAVVLNGRYLDREALDGLLERARELAAPN